MKPHPRIRRTIKWGGAALTVVLMAVWIASWWRPVGWMDSGGLVAGVGLGEVFRAQYNPTPESGLVWAPHTRGDNWRANGEEFHTVFSHFAYTLHPQGVLRLWLLIGTSLLATVAAWCADALARRRARAGFCPKCDYDRRGLPRGPAAKCPECGTPTR